MISKLIPPLSTIAVQWWHGRRRDARDKAALNRFDECKSALDELHDRIKEYRDLFTSFKDQAEWLERAVVERIEKAQGHLKLLQPGVIETLTPEEVDNSKRIVLACLDEVENTGLA